MPIKETLKNMTKKSKKAVIIGLTAATGIFAAPKQANADVVVVKTAPRVVHVVQQPRVIVKKTPTVVVKQTPVVVEESHSLIDSLANLVDSAAHLTGAIVHATKDHHHHKPMPRPGRGGRR